MINKFTLAATASLALALAACDDGAEVEEDLAVDDAAMETEAVVITDDAYPVGGELDAEQQARLDAMDAEAVSEEYDRNREAMMAESGSSTTGTDSSGSAAMSSGDTASSGDSMTSGSETASSGTTPALRPRSQMDFAFLDRNDDGELSVAEYAIWAVPANPRTPAENDETRPYLTPDQINEAGRTFFYFDRDGDTYLSQSEFMNARNSAIAP